MNPISLGRRSFVRGLPLAGAAAMLPAVAVAAPVETHRDRIDRLTEELSHAMTAAARDGDYVAQKFRAVIDSEGGCFFESRAHAREVYNLSNFIHSNDHAALADYHAVRLGSALAKSRGGRWVGTEIRPRGNSTYGVLMFVQHPGATASFTQVFA